MENLDFVADYCKVSDYYKLLISCFFCSFTILTDLSSQSIFERFGVEKYGNTFEEPFYTADEIKQDSLGRLQFRFDNSIIKYDGNSFTKIEEDHRGKFIGTDTLHHVHWYKPDLFTALCYRGDSLYLSINTKDYFEFNFHYIYQDGPLTYLVTNSGLLEYEWIDEEITFKRRIPVIGQDLYELYTTQDTFYFRTKVGTKYMSRSHIDTEYRRDNSTSRNGLFYLSKDEVIYHNSTSENITSRDQYQRMTNPLHRLLIENTTSRGKTYLIDSKNRMWLVGSDKSHYGLYVLNPGEDVLYKVEVPIPESAYVVDMYEDTEGNIWISTGGEGLIQLYDRTIQILDSDAGLSSNNIWSIEQSKNGDIYLATGCAGVDIIRPDGSLDHIRGNGCQRSMLSDSQDRLWINTVGVDLLKDEKLVKNFKREEGLYSRTTKCQFEDSNGDIWIGTRKAIHRYNGNGFTAFVNDSLSDFNRVYNIVELTDGRLMLAFSDGEIFHFADGAYTEIESPSPHTSHLFKDRDGMIWLATAGDGLYKYNNSKFIRIVSFDIVSAGVVYLQDDLEGNLWALCDDNTIRYTDKNKLWNNLSPKINSLTDSDGIPLLNNNTKMQPAAELLQDGKIIFPNIHGAIVVDPQKKKRTKAKYNSVIEYANGLTSLNKRISLPNGTNDILFSLHNISLHPESSFEYQFSLKDKKWINVSDPNNINIYNMPNGLNRIHIRSRYKDDVWNQGWVDITVPTPIYMRWWFLLTTALLFMGILTMLVKWRTGIVKSQNRFLEEKVSEQTMELQNEKEQLAKSLGLQKKLTHELNLSQQSKNRMYAQISHEFKSPLQAINSYLSSSKDHISAEDKNRISGNIKQLLNTSSEIMDLSKAESGTLKAKKDYYNINNIIQEQIELKNSLAKDKEIAIQFSPQKDKVYMHCDISLMQKAIGNLLSNAIKFSNVGDIITVSSTATDSKQCIAVADSGIGIPSDEIENLTLAYFQASNSNEDGTGIGLSFVNRILHLHESRLNIESQLDEGSVFSFTMNKPKLTDHEIETKFLDFDDVNAQLSRLINPKKKTILVVDDSVDILHFVRRSLNDQYNVITSTSGITAIKYLNEIAPVLILSDVNMPVMSGNELLKEVRQISKYESIPFLLITGSISDETELSGIRSGADYVLQKPIEVDFLRSQIKQILNRETKLLDKAKDNFIHGLLPVHMLDDDRAIIQQMEQFILKNLGNTKMLSIDIANALGVGEKTLRNRVKSITGFTIKEYLKKFRLEKAKLLLDQEYGTKGEVANAVGFSSLSYFSKSYKKYFESKKV